MYYIDILVWSCFAGAMILTYIATLITIQEVQAGHVPPEKETPRIHNMVKTGEIYSVNSRSFMLTAAAILLFPSIFEWGQHPSSSTMGGLLECAALFILLVYLARALYNNFTNIFSPTTLMCIYLAVHSFMVLTSESYA